MLADLLIPLVAVGLAELGDKTQLSIFLLSLKVKKHIYFLLGTVLAFLVVDGIAVVLGSWIADLIPTIWLKIGSGIVFIIFGILIIGDIEILGDTGLKKLYFKNSFLSGFLLIFLTEWGDKTQIASALFATRYNPMMVLIGIMIALTLLTIVAIYLGKLISKKVDEKLMTKIAGIIFIIMGISFFFL